MPRTFQEFCAQFTTADVPHVVHLGKRWFYDPRQLLGTVRETMRGDVFSVGVYLGEERREFQPTSALIDLLARQGGPRVTVDTKAAGLFLYGRDVLMSSAQPTDAEPGTLVFVQNQEGDVLGYGKLLAKHDRRLRNKVYVKHLLDRGEYLRREK
jgi:ribosome biogenesis protein Nip4